MELFRKLLLRRNNGERRRRYAPEAKPVFAGDSLQRLKHFVPNTDVDVKARKVSSIHACLDGIPAATLWSPVQILPRFSDEEFEIVVKARRGRFLEHGTHLFTAPLGDG
jgi:hypothetical protein